MCLKWASILHLRHSLLSSTHSSRAQYTSVALQTQPHTHRGLFMLVFPGFLCKRRGGLCLSTQWCVPPLTPPPPSATWYEPNVPTHTERISCGEAVGAETYARTAGQEVLFILSIPTEIRYRVRNLCMCLWGILTVCVCVCEMYLFSLD